jgi:alpha-amylase
MNWRSLDTRLLEHWRRLGQFRSRHVALARGAHRLLSEAPYAFSRVDAPSGDRVVVAMDVQGPVTLPVGDAFAEGSTVRDAYSGHTAVVRDGRVQLEAQRWVLLEGS